MIERQHDAAGKVTATFRLSAGTAQRAELLGEFNDWAAYPMTEREGEFAATIELEPGRRYRFRYLVDGNRWENDWAADAYVPNEYGGDDSVIDLVDGWVGETPADEPATPTITSAEPEPPTTGAEGGSGTAGESAGRRRSRRSRDGGASPAR